MIFKRIAAWIAYEIREEKITLFFTGCEENTDGCCTAPCRRMYFLKTGAERFDMISRL